MITYSRATSDDTQILMEILRAVRGDTKDMSGEQFVIAKNAEKIIGCTRIKQLIDCLELASVAVLPEYRKQGIGLALVKYILETDNRRPIYLLCFAETCNFYLKAGFNIIDLNLLPNSLKQEYDRVALLLKASNKRIEAMSIS